jgi:two-component system, chemotaxis family, chemotaxis protein CheY
MQHYRSILIVDDSPTSRMIIQRCVEMSGFGVDEFLNAENGIDALTILGEKNTVDIIFSDINMPKMDGQTFIRLLKNKTETAKIPVVITSSIADGLIESEMGKLGVTAIIKKPVSPEKIMNALEAKK